MLETSRFGIIFFLQNKYYIIIVYVQSCHISAKASIFFLHFFHFYGTLLLMTLYISTHEADSVRVEELKTPTPPSTANIALSSEAPMGAICSLLKYN